jgi:hypothetical protein
MTQTALCREIFLRDWLLLVLKEGEPQWSSSRWLCEWSAFLEVNLRHCREQGIGVRLWLRTLRSMPTEYIGADWMVNAPRNFEARFFTVPESLGDE